MFVHKRSLIASYVLLLLQGACLLRAFAHAFRKKSIPLFSSFGFLFEKTSLTEFKKLPFENSYNLCC